MVCVFVRACACLRVECVCVCGVRTSVRLCECAVRLCVRACVLACERVYVKGLLANIRSLLN